jgi:hypothetical protein
MPVETVQKLEPHNPDGYACPKCRGRNLIVAEDKSAFCIDCNLGFTNLLKAEKRKPVTGTTAASTSEKKP